MDLTTWDNKEDMLSRNECFSPAVIEADEDKHETLGVEGGPAEEKANTTTTEILIYQFARDLDKYYQAFEWQSFPPGLYFWMIKVLICMT